MKKKEILIIQQVKEINSCENKIKSFVDLLAFMDELSKNQKIEPAIKYLRPTSFDLISVSNDEEITSDNVFLKFIQVPINSASWFLENEEQLKKIPHASGLGSVWFVMNSICCKPLLNAYSQALIRELKKLNKNKGSLK